LSAVFFSFLFFSRLKSDEVNVKLSQTALSLVACTASSIFILYLSDVLFLGCPSSSLAGYMHPIDQNKEG